jgi:hypothetical protein
MKVINTLNPYTAIYRATMQGNVNDSSLDRDSPSDKRNIVHKITQAGMVLTGIRFFSLQFVVSEFNVNLN